MGFNVGAFIKDTAKTAIDIITGSIVNDTTAGLNQYTISSANSTAQSLTAVGASYKSAAAIAAQTCDVVSSRGDPYFYGIAAQDVTKTAAAEISTNRSLGSEDTNFLLENVVPDTKIALKKAEKAETVMAVL